MEIISSPDFLKIISLLQKFQNIVLVFKKKKFYLFLHEKYTHTHTQRQRNRQREKQAPIGESQERLDPETLGSYPEPKADVNH